MTDTRIVEVVASGALETVQQWGGLLRKAEIAFELRQPCEDDSKSWSYAELWVDHATTDRARSIIRGNAKTANGLMW